MSILDRTYTTDLDRYKNMTTPVKNANLKQLENDNLYHLGISTSSHNIPEQFGDVRFVCVGGTRNRMQEVALEAQRVLFPAQIGHEIPDLSAASGRYSMFKVGPVLCINHHIGASPLGVVLHELFKLLHYAKVKREDVHMFRIGTSGGLGIPPGTIVITDHVIDAAMRNHFYSAECGKIVPLPCIINKEMSQELQGCASKLNLAALVGGTMGTDDFYLGQGRLDGAFCDYGEDQKKEFIHKLHREYNIMNIEMEAHILSAFTHRAGIRCGIVCTTIVDRLPGDQILFTKDQLKEFEKRPTQVVIEYIRRRVKENQKTDA